MNTRILAMTAATLACALGIGVFMQKAAPSRSLEPSRPALASGGASDPVIPDDPRTGAFKIENITLTSVPRQDRQGATKDADDTASMAAPDDCALSLKAGARPGALVDLSVSAPCLAGERVTVHHQGMMFTATLDDTGALTTQVPALSSTAVFIVEPLRGAAEIVAVSVPDLQDVDRVVLQWGGNSGFEIHARENGAEYGTAGHVWYGSDPENGLGRILRLGDASQLAPRLVEVYSVPRDADESGFVQLSVETEISAINCGRDIEAQVLTLSQPGNDHRVRTRDLTLAMPDCSAQGDFLVLNNLLENLKIAAN